MRILIVGAGRMGFSLAQEFDAAGHEVYLVDTDPERVEMARTRLDVMAVRGSGCSINILRELGARDADLLLAVSGSDEVNTVSCLIGRELGIQRRIARIESRDLAENIRELDPSVLAVDEGNYFSAYICIFEFRNKVVPVVLQIANSPCRSTKNQVLEFSQLVNRVVCNIKSICFKHFCYLFCC